MIYRELGDTGIRVSEIGFGCEGMLNKTPEEVRAYIDAMDEVGANVIDLYAPNPDMRTNLGLALVGRRDRFVLQAHICSVWQNGQYKRTRNIDEMREGFEDQLRRLQTDHVEIGMIHYVDGMDDWNEVLGGDTMRYAKELLAEGKIGCIGLSSHNPDVALAAVETGLIKALMFSVNPCYDLLPANEDVDELFKTENYVGGLVNMDPQRQKLYETCQRMGVGITVMKAFGGGDLLSDELSPAGRALTVNQCLHYALTRPGVASVMCGARTVEQLKASIAYEDAPESERDYAQAFAEMKKISWQGHCMYCGHCAPSPRGILIADVTKFLKLCTAQREVPETVREHYGLLEHKAGECIACGACEKRCPFGVGIIENMKRAKETFGA